MIKLFPKSSKSVKSRGHTGYTVRDPRCNSSLRVKFLSSITTSPINGSLLFTPSLHQITTQSSDFALFSPLFTTLILRFSVFLGFNLPSPVLGVFSSSLHSVVFLGFLGFIPCFFFLGLSFASKLLRTISYKWII